MSDSTQVLLEPGVPENIREASANVTADGTGEVDISELARLVPEYVADRLQIVPLSLTGVRLVIACLHSLDIATLHELELFTGYTVEQKPVERADFDAQFRRCYHAGAKSVEEVIHDIEGIEGTGLELVRGDDNDEETSSYRLEDLANDAPVIKLVNSILMEAVQRRATDVHVEPFEGRMRIRFRIDGVLYDVPPPPKKLYLGIVSRIKIMAGLDIAEKRLPQDGRIRVKLLGRELDIRVSTIPVLHGESVVLRILDSSNLLLDLSGLGFASSVERAFRSVITRTNGIIMVTGPTGCGKTTTLYAAINALNSPGKKIVTIEDPVEYELAGVNQVPVKPKIDFDFANGLRSILRQDPDIIMVGEIRDLETATIAVQAALTGHLVFSTIHTNDAASTVTRLLDMGVEPYLVSSSVRAILAQRLVRVLCPACRRPVPAGESDWATVVASQVSAQTLPEPPAVLYEPQGCPLCGGLGYKGRTGIYEFLTVDDEIEQLIMSRAYGRAIAENAMSHGMTTLLVDGLAKVSAGITSLDEILRVVHG